MKIEGWTLRFWGWNEMSGLPFAVFHIISIWAVSSGGSGWVTSGGCIFWSKIYKIGRCFFRLYRRLHGWSSRVFSMGMACGCPFWCCVTNVHLGRASPPVLRARSPVHILTTVPSIHLIRSPSPSDNQESHTVTFNRFSQTRRAAALLNRLAFSGWTENWKHPASRTVDQTSATRLTPYHRFIGGKPLGRDEESLLSKII